MALVTPSVLTHMTHIEELPLFGKDALHLAVRTLRDVYSALKGDSSPVKISLKADGAPSCVITSDFNGQSFVATKGFFSKEPKYATTQEEVQTLYGHAPELAEKMGMLLKYAPMLGVPKNQIWQGDFLFSRNDLKKQIIDGEDCIVFHPNTIVYAIPSKDPLARRILNSEFGVVWHTRYLGESIPNLKISFDIDVNELNRIPSVFQIDANLSIPDAMLSPEEDSEIRPKLDLITKESPKIESSLDTLLTNENLALYLTTYRNAIIREGSESVDFDRLISWVKDRYDKAIATKKQAKTQEAYARKRDEELAWLQEHSDEIKNLVAFEDLIRDVKELFIKKLNTLGSFKTLVNSLDKGYIPASQEGFAVSDQEGNITKLVSRLEFSRNNFSKEIVKGWMSDKRMQEAVDQSLLQNVLKLAWDNGLNTHSNQSLKSSVQKLYDPSNQRAETRDMFVNTLRKNGYQAEPFINGTTPAIGVDGQIKLLFKNEISMKRSADNDMSVEQMHLRGLQKEINRALEECGQSSINLVIKDDVVKNVASAHNVAGVPKADFYLADPDGNPLYWISHKAGTKASQFQQYGGVSSEMKNPEVSLFIKKLFKLLREGDNPFIKIPPKTNIYSELSDDDLMLRALFGNDFESSSFGRNNCNAIMQGEMTLSRLRDNVYQLSASHILINGEIPGKNDPYRPVIQVTYRAAYSTVTPLGHILDGRIMILPLAKVTNKKRI